VLSLVYINFGFWVRFGILLSGDTLIIMQMAGHLGEGGERILTSDGTLLNTQLSTWFVPSGAALSFDERFTKLGGIKGDDFATLDRQNRRGSSSG